ncbi:hypothetical protein BX600DRAFT_367673, partial [Xylariales sp. PMI_506]
LGHRLHLAPISHVQNALNVETCCGTWVIEFVMLYPIYLSWLTGYVAEKYPFASVIGVDNSYMQDTFVPPNCEIVLDDIGARHWGRAKSFDFIFTR